MIQELIKHYFPHEPTAQQESLIQNICEFLYNEQSDLLFVLNGYAGTGKTSLLSALVKALDHYEVDVVLLAPTGRAAKVLSGYSEKPASTIHRKIYYSGNDSNGGMLFKLQANKYQNAVFIVDEASMIGNGSSYSGDGFSGNNLLEDLIYYAFSGINCKLIFMGDTAQLPPIGLSVSPALNLQYLKSAFNLELYHQQLTEVVRQTSDSGILYNATQLRTFLDSEDQNISIKFKTFPDFIKVDGVDLQEHLEYNYREYGRENILIICRSNKRANQFNQQLRARIFYMENELDAGDLLMVVKNNYFWLPENSPAGFVANGDTIEVLKVKRIYEMYGFKFADVSVRFVDYPDEQEIEVKVLVDTLYSESPALNQSESKRFFDAIMEDYMDIPNKRKRMEEMKKNPWYNALQIKYAYTVTCHKSQGGQWPIIFVDQGYITDEMVNTEFLKWLYTAITRATEKVFLLGFKEEFWGE